MYRFPQLYLKSIAQLAPLLTGGDSMNPKHTLFKVLSATVVLLVLAAACATPTPQTIVQTQVVTQIVAGTPVETVI